MRQLATITAFVLLASALGMAAVDVPVPSACTPQVNQKLAALLNSHVKHNVDNVMVCGITISPSRRTRGGRHGVHDIVPVLAKFSDGSTMLIQVVVNEDLDGRVTAPKGAAVFAFGQAFFDNTGRFAAGIHDVHCSTHRGADNGWVVINGNKTPQTCDR